VLEDVSLYWLHSNLLTSIILLFLLLLRIHHHLELLNLLETILLHFVLLKCQEVRVLPEFAELAAEFHELRVADGRSRELCDELFGLLVELPL